MIATASTPATEVRPWAITSAFAKPVQAWRSSMYGPVKLTRSATSAMFGGTRQAGLVVMTDKIGQVADVEPRFVQCRAQCSGRQVGIRVPLARYLVPRFK